MLEEIFGQITRARPEILYPSGITPTPAKEPEGSLDHLLHQKSRILQTKLEVLALEIIQRWGLKSSNLEKVERDRDILTYMLGRVARDANYHLRQHQDKRVFYELIFSLEKQKRQEEVECWRDVVQVMRDFLAAWEAHELAKARAIFLADARP